MTDRELKNLSKAELIDIILRQTAEEEKLMRQVEALSRQVENRTLAVRDIGSIAQAALEVNGVFASAQSAADQYLATILEMKQTTQLQCRDMVEKTKEYCDKMENEAMNKCTAMETDTKNRCSELLYDAQEKAKITLASLTSALRDYYLAHEEQLSALPSDLQMLIRNPY